ncbi:response regulator transcription factor [Nodularia sphaerocarpa]|uniref:response regulator transcription factor n=1 Tax=Nodularia sphaerocarpa TaxID=137816 RepID=UPI001EFAA973|nr:response regulator transcription factor [Nodularia sphaerocarpa]MDB9374970.1 response regulator transcription factor [Nodularia sphaerocarpa CS-585]MDB9379686.1 response regulator transcription factor [Nodularia sphaerocarpa CS-585A2]ULP73154.1 Response regulator MprA [Nodularia sphaerocarpa UHCC 0038]
MRILVVEDDIQLAEVLTEALNRRQYVVDVAKDGEAAWNSAESMKYDLVLLDVTLPKLDGIRFCQRLRTAGTSHPAHRNCGAPVLMLTARDTVADKIAGLDAGADDYVAKPFDLEELMARIRALLRRGSSASTVSLSWEKLHLNPSTYEVSYNSCPLILTPKEYAILELLVANGRRVLSRSSIIEQVWSVDDSPVEETVRSHIKCLRQKLRALDAPENFIETVHGLGYRLK